ncbi:MAG: hypothetical protein HQK51_08845 [Oligoflexia bacterium]|nr:hypothetical protein [Oligoflexia bacterium]
MIELQELKGKNFSPKVDSSERIEMIKCIDISSDKTKYENSITNRIDQILTNLKNFKSEEIINILENLNKNYSGVTKKNIAQKILTVRDRKKRNIRDYLISKEQYSLLSDLTDKELFPKASEATIENAQSFTLSGFPLLKEKMFTPSTDQKDYQMLLDLANKGVVALNETDMTEMMKIMGNKGDFTSPIFYSLFNKYISNTNVNPNLQNSNKWTIGMMAARYAQPEVALAIAKQKSFICDKDFFEKLLQNGTKKIKADFDIHKVPIEQLEKIDFEPLYQTVPLDYAGIKEILTVHKGDAVNCEKALMDYLLPTDGKNPAHIEDYLSLAKNNVITYSDENVTRALVSALAWKNSTPSYSPKLELELNK